MSKTDDEEVILWVRRDRWQPYLFPNTESMETYIHFNLRAAETSWVATRRIDQSGKEWCKDPVPGCILCAICGMDCGRNHDLSVSGWGLSG